MDQMSFTAFKPDTNNHPHLFFLWKREQSAFSCALEAAVAGVYLLQLHSAVVETRHIGGHANL